MKNTWRHFLRRLAATAVVGGSVAWSSAMCYAVTLAYDDASDPVYNNGWQQGDDGGTGILGPWNFDGTYDTAAPGQQAVDDGLKLGTQTSSTFNDIGKAWTVFNPVGRPQDTANGAAGTDIAQAGRAITGGLAVGSTLKMVVGNPAERFFFRGWTLKLNNGGASGCYAGDNCTTPAYDPGSITPRFALGTFEYFTYGQWYMTSVSGAPGVPLYDRDDVGQVGTDSGLQIEFTLTGADTFTAKMIPLDNPGATFEHSGTLDGTSGSAIDWIGFEFYNTDSDYYPTMVPANARATDFYIRSIEITDAAPPGQPGDYNGDGKVDAADYVAWRKIPGNFGGDPGGYNTWRENFAEGGAGASGGVPEPATFVYLVVGAFGLGSLAVFRHRSGGHDND